MTFLQLLSTTKEEIEIIRSKPAMYSKPKLDYNQLETLRQHLCKLYPCCNVQTAFAYRIYMKTA